MSDSGKSSKLEVSSMLLISMEMAAGRSLRRQDRGDHGRQFQDETNMLTWCKGALHAARTWCAPSPRTQKTDDSWSPPRSPLQSCSQHRCNTWNTRTPQRCTHIIWIALRCPLNEENESLHTLISSLWPSPRWGPQAGRRGFLSSSSPSCTSPAASQSRREGSLNTANSHFNSN